LTRETLIDRVWGMDYVGDTKTLDVHVKRLRAKVEPDPANPIHIVTIRGFGARRGGGATTTAGRCGVWLGRRSVRGRRSRHPVRRHRRVPTGSTGAGG